MSGDLAVLLSSERAWSAGTTDCDGIADFIAAELAKPRPEVVAALDRLGREGVFECEDDLPLYEQVKDIGDLTDDERAALQRATDLDQP